MTTPKHFWIEKVCYCDKSALCDAMPVVLVKVGDAVKIFNAPTGTVIDPEKPSWRPTKAEVEHLTKKDIRALLDYDGGIAVVLTDAQSKKYHVETFMSYANMKFNTEPDVDAHPEPDVDAHPEPDVVAQTESDVDAQTERDVVALMPDVLQEDKELNAKTEATIGTVTIHVATCTNTFKLFYHYENGAVIADVEKTIAEVIGISVGHGKEFRLVYQGSNSFFEAWEPLHATVLDNPNIMLAVAMVGGAKTTVATKQKSAKRATEVKKHYEDSIRIVEGATDANVTEVKRLMSVLVNEASINPQDTLKHFLELSSADDLEKAMGELTSSTGATEDKVGKASLYLLGEAGHRVIEEHDRYIAIKGGMKSSLIFAFKHYVSSGDKSISLKDLNKLLNDTLQRKIGASQVGGKQPKMCVNLSCLAGQFELPCGSI